MKFSSTLATIICTSLLTAGVLFTARVFYVPTIVHPAAATAAATAPAPISISPVAVLSSPETTDLQPLLVPLPSANLRIPVILSIPSEEDETARREDIAEVPRPAVRKASSVNNSGIREARPQEKPDALPAEVASRASAGGPALVERAVQKQEILTVSDKETRDYSLRLKAGTKIYVTVDERLTVSRAEGPQGGRFKGILNRPLRAGHDTIAEKGSFVEGSFAPAEGENDQIVLALNLISLRTVNDTILTLETATVDRGHRSSKAGIWKGLAVAGMATSSMLVPRTTYGAPVTTAVAQGLISPNPSQLMSSYGPVMPVVLEGTKVEFKLKHDLFIAKP